MFDSPMVYLAHGASGTAASMRPYVMALEARGLEAVAIDLPKRKAEAAVPVFLTAVTDAPRAVIGGHSYGGRVASLAAAEVPERGFLGLVLLSYPLHRPGHPESLRTEHWSAIRCPMLFLSGDADPFARIELLRNAVRRFPSATLHVYPGQGHGLLAVADDVADQIAHFTQALARRSLDRSTRGAPPARGLDRTPRSPIHPRSPRR